MNAGRQITTDEDRVELLARMIATAELFFRDGRRESRRLFDTSVQDFLELLLGRRPTADEIRQMMTAEVL